MYWNWKAKVVIIQEVKEPLTRYDNFRIHMSEDRLIKHRRTEIFNKFTEIKLIWRDVEMAER